MKARDLREKSIDELRNAETELKEQLFKLRFQKATGQIENPIKIRMVRKDIARVETVLAERLRQAE
jgi:large subunit ribosomal protein L29